MKNVKYPEFYKKFVTRTSARLRSPLINRSEDLHLPRPSAVHYMPETTKELGPDISNTLLRNIGDRALTYHVDKLIVAQGKVNPLKSNASSMARAYHKRYRKFQAVRNIEKSNLNDRIHMVVNYALLQHMNKYVQNNMVSYQEWANNRATMWQTIRELDTHRHHFIQYNMPKFLPSKADLDRYSRKFSVTAMDQFHAPETLDLLELWSIVTEDIESVELTLEDGLMDKVHFVFVESGQCSVIKMLDLVGWVRENPDQTQKSFYHFLDSMLSLRTVVESAKVVDKEDDVTKPEVEGELESAIEVAVRERGAAGQLSGAEQKGLIKLSQRYKELPNPFTGEGTLAEAKVTPEEINLTGKPVMKDSPTIMDKSMLSSKLQDFDNQYVDSVMQKDIIGMVLNIQKAGVIVKNMKVTDKKNAVTDQKIVSVQLQPIGGKASTIKFTIPNIQKDGTFLSNGVRCRLEKQRGDMPILKIKPFTVALTSYYGKAFIVRNQNATANYGRWIKTRIGKRATDPQDTSITNVIYGINTYKGDKLPRPYTAIGEAVTSFTTGKYVFNFAWKRREEFFTPAEISQIEKERLTPCGRFKGGLLGMDADGIVYELIGKSTNPIGTVPSVIDPDMGEGPLEYSEVSVFNKRVPTILALAYWFGLDKALKKLKISYTRIPPNARYAASPNIYRIKFKDEAYLVDVKDPKTKMLVAGFNALRRNVNGYNSNDFNKRSTFTSALSAAGVTQHHLRELGLMFDMFIDPITLELLEGANEPTDFAGLLVRANELLVDDHTPKFEEVRFKGYERISGMIYGEMITSLRGYRSRGTSAEAEVAMNPKAVWLDILQDQSVVLVEDSNPIRNLKEKEGVTFSGAGGRSSRSMVKETRAFNENDLGVISEATPDSAKTGVRTFLSANPNIENVRGVVRAFDPKTDGAAAVLSTSALMAPAVNHDDGKRVNFINVQNDHTVPTVGYKPLPLRTGYEQVLGARADDLYATKASQAGKVISVSDDAITVEYKDKTRTTYELGTKHGTASGVTIPHTIVSDLKPGNKFGEGDVIVFNSGFFQRDAINKGAVAFKAGVIARVALLESSDTIEDGCVIGKGLAEKLVTPSTALRPVIVDFDMTIHNLIKVGDDVDPETILCTLEDAVSADLTESDSVAVGALTKLAASNPKAKSYGRVSRVEVLYFGDKEDMSPSVLSVVEQYDKVRASKAKKLADGAARSGQIDEPIHIGGKKMTEDKVAIKIYIDGNITLGTGDKVVFGNQLKSTCSRVSTDEILTEDGQEIDAFFGYQSIASRIVLSPELSGTMNACLAALSKGMARIHKEGK